MPGRPATKADARIGKRIKLAREHEGMTQDKLGELIGVTRQALKQYEDGRARPAASTVEQIAKVMRLPVQWFFGK